MISRLFCGFCNLFFLMWAQIFFVTSLRGSGSEPTTLASSAEGCIGFIKALLLFPLPAAFPAALAISLSCDLRLDENVLQGIVFDAEGVYSPFAKIRVAQSCPGAGKIVSRRVEVRRTTREVCREFGGGAWTRTTDLRIMRPSL